ncbi:hypothetical protein BTZ20_1142 [Rhodococcus sp. MTM3W5.2]|nr:hypothetical protein BTZ20_1142 [Rhodococcus sp. MTM3W5.2]
MSKIRPGDLIITRTETWGALDGGRATGTFSARVDGLPGEVTGTLTLAPRAPARPSRSTVGSR